MQYLNLSENEVFPKTNNNILEKNNLELNRETKFLRKKKSNIKYKYILIPLIILLLKISFFKHKLSKTDIDFEENFPNITESFNNAKQFLKICLDNKLINNTIIKPSENPKVSVVIPLHNKKRTISRAIKSVQNQILSDIEIILIDDLSADETLYIIKQIQKEEPRIKIIENQKYMGTLYSRSIGALSAKGEYIFPLDGDDMLLDKDIYSTITKIADKGNFDIVGYRGLEATVLLNNISNNVRETFFSDYNNNLMLFQPELGNFPLEPGNKYGEYIIKDVYLWIKCIKTNIYQKALNKAGDERYSRYMLNHEDVVATYFLFNTAESLIYVGKYGVLHIPTRHSSSSKKYSEISINIYNIYLIDIVIAFNKKTFKNRRILVYLITYVLEKSTLKETFEENEYVKNLFISCLNKILNMRYISYKDKTEIRNRISKLNFLKY